MGVRQRYRPGLLAVAVAVVAVGFGCSTTAPRTEKATEPQAPGLNAAEERRALALAHYATALSIAANQGVSAALPEYRQAWELDPGNLPFGLVLSEMYRQHRDTTNSLAVLDSLIKRYPKAAEPRVAQGLTYRTADDAPHAVEAFRQALKLDPSHFGAIRALAETYNSQNDTNNLVALLEQTFRQRSDDANYWSSLGDLYGSFLRQRPSLAARLDKTRIRQSYEKAIALAPNDPEILARVASAYVEANDLKAAAEAYTRLMQLRPNIPELRERLAALYLKTDQKEKAAALYKEIIKRDPLRFEFYNDLALLSEDLNKPEEALDYYEQSLKLNPDQSEVFLAVCELQRLLKRKDAALKTLAEWRKKFPLDWRVPYMHAFIYTEDKDYARAVTKYEEAESMARSAPQEVQLTPQFYFSFGAAYERNGQVDKAAPMFRKAIELDSTLANAYNYLGYMWADKGTNLTESLSLIQKAVDLDPDNGAFLDSLGWVYYKLGRAEEALPQLKHAVALLEKDEKRDKEDRADDAVVYDHLAEVLMKLGKQTEAIQNWKKAADLDPANKEIAAKLQKYNPDHTAAPH